MFVIELLFYGGVLSDLVVVIVGEKIVLLVGGLWLLVVDLLVLNIVVLVVEDYGVMWMMLVYLFICCGFYVVIVVMLEEVRKWVEECVFDFIILDIGLLDGSGYMFMLEYWGCWLGVLGIVFSGYGMEDDVVWF